MGRAERRKQGIREKVPSYTLTGKQLEMMLQQAHQEGVQEAIRIATDEAFVLMISIPIKVMHDKYGWRQKKRLPELAEAIADEYQRFSDGAMAAEEYKQFVYKHTGMMFNRVN